MNPMPANTLNEKLFKHRPAPNFLIVGAARAGTTSLWHWLRRHPQVFMSRDKEPAYFVQNGFRAMTKDKYLSMFAAGEGKPCIGEASTGYLPAAESPPWIREVLGPVKIIIILRNPVERAFSMYCFMAMMGLEPIETFEEALDQESRRMASLQFHQNCFMNIRDYQYFHVGLYVDQVMRYIKTFGAERVKILLFDDLKKDPSGFCADVCQFLEIPYVNGHALTRENSVTVPRSISLQYRLRDMRVQTRKRLGVSDRAVTCLPIMAMLVNAKRGTKRTLSSAVRADLVERYRTSVEQLADLVHRDLSHWLK
ncbi:MAG TPA: sulfotransferase domain-containing protein [Opitutaceae bacterium]|jgi:hypothetical protein|nr:sulfotransferase domain-containing protein [Opitutaceae bacterium]